MVRSAWAELYGNESPAALVLRFSRQSSLIRVEPPCPATPFDHADLAGTARGEIDPKDPAHDVAANTPALSAPPAASDPTDPRNEHGWDGWTGSAHLPHLSSAAG